jgi:hypothetical protein
MGSGESDGPQAPPSVIFLSVRPAVRVLSGPRSWRAGSYCSGSLGDGPTVHPADETLRGS